MVRRDFVKALLSRKALPKNAQRFITHTIAHSNYILGKALNKTSLTAELLGTGDGYGEFKAYVDKPTTKPEMITLATMITAYEGNIDRTSWRNRHHRIPAPSQASTTASPSSQPPTSSSPENASPPQNQQGAA